MKLTLQQKEDLPETEILVRYAAMTSQLSHMVRYIRQYEYTVEGVLDNKTYYLPLENILYFDTVERKTFLYTPDNFYECKKNISELENELSQTTVVRIGKGLLLNVSALLNVKPYPNHRLLAEISSGETLIVSRKYIPLLQERIRRAFYEKSI